MDEVNEGGTEERELRAAFVEPKAAAVVEASLERAREAARKPAA